MECRRSSSTSWRLLFSIQVRWTSRSFLYCVCLTICSSSVLMQKLQCFPFTPYILEASQTLALQQLLSSDKFIPVMVNIQRIIENVDSLAARHKHMGLNQSFSARVESLRQELSYLKSSVSFPLMENSTFHLRLN